MEGIIMSRLDEEAYSFLSFSFFWAFWGRAGSLLTGSLWFNDGSGRTMPAYFDSSYFL